MNYIELPFVKMSADAKIPTRATEESAGLDFYSPADYIIPPHGQLLVPTHYQASSSSGLLRQIGLKVKLGHITPTTCGSGSHRP